VRLGRIPQVALVEEDRLGGVLLLPVGLRDVVEEAGIGLLVVALLPGLDRLVELPEVVILRPLLEQQAGLLGVLRPGGRRADRHQRDDRDLNEAED